jgi:hypothetical protein
MYGIMFKPNFMKISHLDQRLKLEDIQTSSIKNYISDAYFHVPFNT